MLNAARMETGTEGPADELVVGPSVKVEVEVAARRSSDDGTGDSADELFVEPTVKLNGRAKTGTGGSADELFVGPKAKGLLPPLPLPSLIPINGPRLNVDEHDVACTFTLFHSQVLQF